jgi:hypothetical protein
VLGIREGGAEEMTEVERPMRAAAARALFPLGCGLPRSALDQRAAVVRGGRNVRDVPYPDPALRLTALVSLPQKGDVRSDANIEVHTRSRSLARRTDLIGPYKLNERIERHPKWTSMASSDKFEAKP